MLKKIFAIVLVLACTPVLAQNVAVIVNSSVTESTLDQAALEKIFLGKRSHWADGGAIVPVTLAEGAVHDAFLETYIKKNASQFSAFWKQAVFTGKGTPPRSFKTEEELVRYVAATPGAVGYLSTQIRADGVRRIETK